MNVEPFNDRDFKAGCQLLESVLTGKHIAIQKYHDGIPSHNIKCMEFETVSGAPILGGGYDNSVIYLWLKNTKIWSYMKIIGPGFLIYNKPLDIIIIHHTPQSYSKLFIS